MTTTKKTSLHPCNPGYFEHDWQGNGSIGSSTHDYKTYILYEFECSQCHQTFVEEELKENVQ